MAWHTHAQGPQTLRPNVVLPNNVSHWSYLIRYHLLCESLPMLT